MITFENTGKAFRNRKGEVEWVFRNFSANIPKGVSVGILAGRGQGKSTFIQVAAGNDTPSEGQIYRRGKVSWPFNTNKNISNRLSGKQNLRFLTDVYGRNFGEVYDFVTEFSELGRKIDMPLSRYSLDMRTRFSISALLGMNFSAILVDESLNGGTAEFRKKYLDYIDANSKNTSFLIATSNPLVVRKYCSSAGVLNAGELTLYDSVSDAVNAFKQIQMVQAEA